MLAVGQRAKQKETQMTVLEHEAPRGLRGVVVTDTELGDVRGLEGFYHYRQYAAVELAERRRLEDVWYLMFEGDLPDDHGFNASTFTARVIASTGADVAAAVTGAIGALSGPLHGGAPSRALDTLDAIGSPGNTAAWVRGRVEAGERIMGFGHPVYR